MPKLWMMLGTVAAAGAAIAATGAAAQDDAAFRTAMMARCATIGDKAARLACYDAAQRSGPTAMPAPSSNYAPPVAVAAPVAASAPATGAPAARAPVAAAATVAAVAAPASAPADQFGRDSLNDGRGEYNGPKELQARAVAATDVEGGGYWTIRLDSGSSWKLVERDSLFRPPTKDASVRIRRGAMGGYLMDVDRQPSVRVRRVD